jgi:hypothetical protein
MDWITGERFISVGDSTYSPIVKIPGDYDNLPNTFDLSKLKEINEVNIVYTHAAYIRQLFVVIAGIKRKFVVVTHNWDTNIDDTFIVPDNVIRWFAQNVNVKNPKIESIPIGLENSWWFPEIQKKAKMLKILETDRKYKRMLYINHNINTNLKERTRPYELFRGKSWVTAEAGTNGSGFDNYLSNIYNHPFVLCPEGHGIDTHRTWECLYLRTIPIEKRNINNQFYTDLPICFVNDWEEITEEFLRDEFLRIADTKWNFQKLTFEYWKKRIH